jgi:translation initiation factor 1
MCPSCGQPQAQCICRQAAHVPKGDGMVRVGRETKGRKGKGVTLITGVPLDADGLQKLAKRLKQKCGAGGSVRDGAIEIQGDHRDALLEELRKQGYAAKRSGG